MDRAASERGSGLGAGGDVAAGRPVTGETRSDPARRGPPSLDAWGFVVAPTEQCTARACTFSSVKYPGRAPADFALLRVYLGGDDGAASLDRDDTTLARVVHEDAAAFLGITAAPVPVRVARHRQVFPQYEVGHLDRVAAIEASLARLPGLALVGAAYRGVGITDTVRSAEERAERVLATLLRPEP